MAVPDISGIIAFLPYLQIFWYIMLSLFFGSIALMGYRGFLPSWLKWLTKVGIGFLCVICGLGMAALIPLMSLLEAMQLDMLIGGIVAGIIFAVSINIISYRMPGLI